MFYKTILNIIYFWCRLQQKREKMDEISNETERSKRISEAQERLLRETKPRRFGNKEPRLWAKNSKFAHSKFGKMVLASLAVLALAVGVYFFKFPNNFVMGGVSGYSVVIAELVPLSAAQITAICNIVLLIIGLLYFGKEFAFLTAYATVMLSVLLTVFEKIFPLTAPLTSEPLLELLFAIGLPALGSVILFNLSASSGGTDVIAMILKDKTKIDIGKALIATDLVACFCSAFVFNISTALFSLLGLFMKGIIVDRMLVSLRRVKYFTLITEKGDLIGDYITLNLHRGATQIIGTGVYSGKERQVLLCVVNRQQAIALQKYAKSVDPTCFLMISDINEIIGRGFYPGF